MANEIMLEPLLIIFSLLFLAPLCAPLFRLLKLPYTVGLLLLGMGLGLLGQLFPVFSPLSHFKLTDELILYLILPTLIFEASINIDVKMLLKNLAPIMLLAVVGVLISCILIGVSLAQLSILPLGSALIFGALISATDPVAVIALFKELKADARLNLLMDGESVFNDATAIALFSVLIGLGGAVTDMNGGDLLNALMKFCMVFFGGVAFGGVMGLMLTALMRFTRGDDFVQRSMMLVMAYMTFIIADHFLHVSGVMAVLILGLVISHNRERAMAKEQWHETNEFWKYAAFVANSLVFIMMGMTEDHLFWNFTQFKELLPTLAITAALVIIARAVIIYGLIPLNNRFKLSAPINMGMQTVMFWGGLRGAVPIALMLALPESMPGRELIVQMVLFMILLTLLIPGTTTGSLLKRFGLSNVRAQPA